MEENKNENYLSANEARNLKPTKMDRVNAIMDQIFDKIEEAALDGENSIHFLLKGEGICLSEDVFEILRELEYEVTTVKYKFFTSIGAIVKW